jgi:hypothetical protein
MTDKPRPGGEAFDWVDPERRAPHNAFDSDEGVSGNGYSRARERQEGERHPSGEVNPQPAAAPSDNAESADLPPDNGRRASFDPRTGEVHGSGSGAGGGHRGEDFDSDSASGDGYPFTGSEGAVKGDHDLGPPRLTE